MNNNNRGNNNRRRGRSNNNRTGGGGGGGGQQLNRIDSRARGNAPQMLEKFRKLAHDAHLNGDRVQEEYYLQFADHYFRVIADTRQRQEDQRARRDDRWQEGGEPQREEADDGGEFGSDNEYPAFDQAPAYTTRREREERGEIPRREDRAPRTERGPREDRGPREERAPRAEPPALPQGDSGNADLAPVEPVNEAPFEPAENPFVRPTRGLKPRREDRRPRREEQAPRDDEAPAAFDPSLLPPAIGAPAPAPEAEAEAKPRRGRPRRKPLADDAGGDTLEALN